MRGYTAPGLRRSCGGNKFRDSETEEDPDGSRTLGTSHGGRPPIRRPRRPEALRVFGGGGLEGTAGMFDQIGLRPGGLNARAAGVAELIGGLMIAFGLLTP